MNIDKRVFNIIVHKCWQSLKLYYISVFKKIHKHSLQSTIVCMNDIKVGVVTIQLLLA